MYQHLGELTNQLPPEVILLILSFVPFTTQFHCKRVSKAWKKAIDSSSPIKIKL